MKALVFSVCCVVVGFGSLTYLLNVLDATPAVSVFALCVAACVTGIGIGLFADRFPDFSRSRRT